MWQCERLQLRLLAGAQIMTEGRFYRGKKYIQSANTDTVLCRADVIKLHLSEVQNVSKKTLRGLGFQITKLNLLRPNEAILV